MGWLRHQKRKWRAAAASRKKRRLDAARERDRGRDSQPQAAPRGPPISSMLSILLMGECSSGFTYAGFRAAPTRTYCSLQVHCLPSLHARSVRCTRVSRPRTLAFLEQAWNIYLTKRSFIPRTVGYSQFSGAMSDLPFPMVQCCFSASYMYQAPRLPASCISVLMSCGTQSRAKVSALQARMWGPSSGRRQSRQHTRTGRLCTSLPRAHQVCSQSTTASFLPVARPISNPVILYMLAAAGKMQC